MAEISYPFSADNVTTGATKAVSELDWQAMASMWGGDRVSHLLPHGNAPVSSVPFQPTVLSVTSVRIAPGRAWLGGFHYELTANQTVSLDPNSLNTGRIDLIVVRLDMSKPGANLAVRKGTNSATPVVPQPVRQAGAIWELPLVQVNVPANGGTITTSTRAPMMMPPSVGYPWNARDSLALTPAGTFGYDLDSNTDWSQNEMFHGRDGLVVTRTLGSSMEYTPELANGGGVAEKLGRWRWIAPGMVWVSIRLHNTSTTTDAKISGTNPAYGVSLPVPASGATGQTMHGMFEQPTAQGGLPNYTDLHGRIPKGGSTSSMIILYPNPANSAAGLDGLKIIPRRSAITFSGVYEAAQTAWTPISGG